MLPLILSTVVATAPPNVMLVLLDDVSSDRFPFTGNKALEGKLPGIKELLDDGGVEYTKHYSYSSLCGPAQGALNSGTFATDFGAQHFFTAKAGNWSQYYAVPDAGFEYLLSHFRSLGYYTSGSGKLDFQVSGAPLEMFFDASRGGVYADTTEVETVDLLWDPAVAQGKPWISFVNFMDHHEFATEGTNDVTPVTDPETGDYFYGNHDMTYWKGLGYTDEDLTQGYGYSGPQPWAKWVGYKRDGTAIASEGEWLTHNDVDLWKSHPIDYRGTFDVHTISAANQNMPNYFLDDLSSKVTLAHEYDLIRNADYRLGKLIKRLKAQGLYDNTVIVVVSDHGSGFQGAKNFMNYASLHSPMWVKYPKGFSLPAHVKTNADGHKYDDAIVNVYDIFPTLMSVTGSDRLYDHMKGKPFAGPLMTDSWKFALGHQGRVGEQVRKNTIVTDGVHMYKKYYVPFNPQFQMKSFFLDSITIAWQRLYQLVNDGTIGMSDSRVCSVTNEIYPVEEFYHVPSDLGTTRNLLYDTTYIADKIGETNAYDIEIRPIRVSRENMLTSEEKQKLAEMRAFNDEMTSGSKWFGAQTIYTDQTLGFHEALVEEKHMIDSFLVNEMQPKTKTPVFMPTAPSDSKSPISEEISLLVSSESHVFIKATSLSTGSKTLTQVLPYDRFGDLSLLDADAKQNMKGFRPAFTKTSYTSTSYPGVTRQGYMFSAFTNRAPYVSAPWGITRYTSGSAFSPFLFISEDFTYLETGIQNFIGEEGTTSNFHGVNIYDSRDSTWNGQEFVGLTSDGEWIGEPIPLINTDGTLNTNAFATYVFGTQRQTLYAAENLPGVPPPKYFAHPGMNPDEQVITHPSGVDMGRGRMYKLWTMPTIDDAETSLKRGAWTFPIMGNLPANPTAPFQASMIFDPIDFAKLKFDLVDERLITEESFVFAKASRLGFDDSAIAVTHVKPNPKTMLATDLKSKFRQQCCGQPDTCEVTL